MDGGLAEAGLVTTAEGRVARGGPPVGQHPLVEVQSSDGVCNFPLMNALQPRNLSLGSLGRLGILS